MINTFKPFLKLTNRTKGTNDLFGLHIDICNEIHIAVSICGYGFNIGVLLVDVNKFKGGMK